MPKNDAFVIAYAAGVCLVSSLLLAGTSAALKKQQDKMLELDRKFNVLKAFQQEVTDSQGQRISGEQIEGLYAEHVQELVLKSDSGELVAGMKPGDITRQEREAKTHLPLFTWNVDGRTTMYAFPVSGKGLWSTIHGYLALDEGLRTILGVTFYRHGETPGLGGEIEKDWFQENFEGIPLVQNHQLQTIKVAKGQIGGHRSEGSTELVDGISGATLTGNGVTRFLNEDIRQYDKYFQTIRKG